MRLTAKVQTLEKTVGKALNAPCCTVVMKDAQECRMTLQEAIQAATEGKARSITFDLTKEEERGFHQLHNKAFSREVDDIILEIFSQERVQLEHPLLYSKLPYAIVHEDKNHTYMGHKIGGYYITENGEVFHQTEKDEFAEKHGIGFFICTDERS